MQSQSNLFNLQQLSQENLNNQNFPNNYKKSQSGNNQNNQTDVQGKQNNQMNLGIFNNPNYYMSGKPTPNNSQIKAYEPELNPTFSTFHKANTTKQNKQNSKPFVLLPLEPSKYDQAAEPSNKNKRVDKLDRMYEDLKNIISSRKSYFNHYYNNQNNKILSNNNEQTNYNLFNLEESLNNLKPKIDSLCNHQDSIVDARQLNLQQTTDLRNKLDELLLELMNLIQVQKTRNTNAK